jgi:hypothetical protein
MGTPIASYFDGSETDVSPNRWLTLACVVGDDLFWSVFNSKWETMLRGRYPIAPYIHMTDILISNAPFERVARMDPRAGRVTD